MYAFTRSHRSGSGSPLVCLHGFLDTWRGWELVLPVLERHHEVLAPTLPGHAGGTPISGDVDDALLADSVERALDEAGFATAHLVGNSLGGFVALQLAGRGRATSVVALAPAGGWAATDTSYLELLAHQKGLQEQLQAVDVDAIAATEEGRRQATLMVSERFEHIPRELIAHQLHGAASCDGASALVDYALSSGWQLDATTITCPVRIIWGAEDKVLPWPSAAARFREEWLPHAEWIVLDGVGHCPQLDVPLETAHLIVEFTGRA